MASVGVKGLTVHSYLLLESISVCSVGFVLMCNISAVLPPPLIALSGPVSREMEKIYDLVPRTDDVFNLSCNELELHNELGTGNFGSVLRGTYKHKGMAIPVAVKTLKKDDLPTAEV